MVISSYLLRNVYLIFVNKLITDTAEVFYALRASRYHLHIYTSWIQQLGSHHLRKSKRINGLKLNMKYLQMLELNLQLLQ